MDEPTIDLAVIAKHAARRFIKAIRDEFGTTILLASHDMTDMEAMCDRIIMLVEGRTIWEGGMEEARRLFGNQRRLTVHCQGDPTELELEGLRPTVTREHQADFDFDADATDSRMLMDACLRDQRILDFSFGEVPFEELVRRKFTEPTEPYGSGRVGRGHVQGTGSHKCGYTDHGHSRRSGFGPG